MRWLTVVIHWWQRLGIYRLAGWLCILNFTNWGSHEVPESNQIRLGHPSQSRPWLLWLCDLHLSDTGGGKDQPHNWWIYHHLGNETQKRDLFLVGSRNRIRVLVTKIFRYGQSFVTSFGFQYGFYLCSMVCSPQCFYGLNVFFCFRPVHILTCWKRSRSFSFGRGNSSCFCSCFKYAFFTFDRF